MSQHRVPKGSPAGGQFAEGRNPPGADLRKFSVFDDPRVTEIVRPISEAGGTTVAVGGAVRDFIRGEESHDLDLEVFGLSMETLDKTFKSNFKVDRTGVQFSVLKVSVGDLDLDIALPRTENKIGRGHTDFAVEVDQDLDFHTAAMRRDFTMNAIGLNLVTGELLDPHHGVADIRDGIIRHVSDQFADDPLRPLRAAKFAGRFGYRIAHETKKLCLSMWPMAEHLPPERIWGELVGILKSKSPGTALKTLVDIGWINVIPEVTDLINVPQDPNWHPEGDVFVHTCHVLDYASGLDISPEDRLTVMVAAMCHDLGKAPTTRFFDGKWRAHGHEEAGVPLTRALLNRLGQYRLTDDVAPLVEHHLAPVTLKTDKALRRLSTKVPRLDLLAQVSRADVGGRPPLVNTKALDSIDAFEEQVRRLSLDDGPPKSLARGEHLIAMGLTPGPRFKELLGAVYDAQIDGDITTEAEAISMLRKLVS